MSALVPTISSPPQTSTRTSTSTPSKIELTKWDLWSSDETMLRGANISQGHVNLELDGPTFKGPGPVGPPYTQDDFDRLSALGANYVSISGPGIFSVHPPYEPLPQIIAYYDEVLSMISKADMFATIGFRTGPGRADWSICCASEDWAQPYLVDTVWLDREAQAAWVNMWRFAAEHFRDHPIVVGYKLMVEPNSAAFHLGIYDADLFYDKYAGSTYDWYSFFPAIIETIRQVDPGTPILVSGDDFSSIEWLPFAQVVEGARVVYYVDQYAPHPYTHQDRNAALSYPSNMDTDYDGITEDFNSDWLENHLSTIDQFKTDWAVPVTVEEYGLVRYAPGAADYLDDLMSMFEARGLNYATGNGPVAGKNIVPRSMTSIFVLGLTPKT